MILRGLLVFLVGPLINFCHSAFVETLPKCSFSDQECLRNLIQGALKDISKNGIEEVNIPPIDPMKLKNIEISVLGLINITLEDGFAKGIKECVIDKVETDLSVAYTQMEVTCDIIIKGKFKVKGASPMVQNLLGGSTIRGDGNAKVKIDKLRMKFDFYYDFVKKQDDNVYIKCRLNRTLYEYDIGNMKISADGIYLGNQDLSELVIPFLNENWRFTMQSFGRSFFDVAMELFYTIIHKFFDTTPTKYYISDDLTSYIKKV